MAASAHNGNLGISLLILFFAIDLIGIVEAKSESSSFQIYREVYCQSRRASKCDPTIIGPPAKRSLDLGIVCMAKKTTIKT